MSRIARIVVPGLPHHVTQRGNHRAAIFFEDGDYALYRDILADETHKAGVAVWAWCLMPNHVRLVLVSSEESGCARPHASALCGFVHGRARRTGHLFQERFSSAPMDEAHLLAALRYVSLNPVRARPVTRAEDWPWSSVRAHLGRCDDALTDVAPVAARVPRLAELQESDPDDPAFIAFRRAEAIGRPLGSVAFATDLATRLGRPVLPRRRGRKPKVENGE